jgi:2-polyprenyl-3-methyl-5-hydroxy-6-metoxy-1,4-benzoquinol methylase
MKSVVENYIFTNREFTSSGKPLGDSASPKEMIFHILANNSINAKVLDIGFGAGTLGALIKANPETNHWSIDGIDGWEANCYNTNLIDRKFYRNIWHGLAQDLSSENLKAYDIICLLDVIEHLNIKTARQLITFILQNLGENSVLFISTPLWFYPQDNLQAGDLEEHLIGVPASSMMALLPRMYAINHPLIGGFVFGKESAPFADFFQPTSNKSFSYEMGLKILNSIGVNYQPNVLFKVNPI